MPVVVDEIDPDGPEPVYRQLAAILRGQILSGAIPPRRPIPSKRTLKERYGVSGLTCVRAVELLKQEGLVRTAVG